MPKAIHYKDFVDYSSLDPFGQASMDKYETTIDNPKKRGIFLLPESIGETARVTEIEGMPFYLAENVEILGTKVAIAVDMARRDMPNRYKYFSGIGQDDANMSLNDLVGVGAQPFSYSPIISLGANEFIKDPIVIDALLDGFKKAADDAESYIGGGETGTCKGVVVVGQADMAGGSQGIISPKDRFCHGGKVMLEDNLYGIVTNTPHANGLTTIRIIADSLPHGYFTELPSGITFGEAVLNPTPGYSSIVNKLFDEGVDIHYLQPITGHGFKKIARPKNEQTYRIKNLPIKAEVFDFIQNHQGIDDKEMFETYNCSIGFVVYAPPGQDERILRISEDMGFEMMNIGEVEEGPRRVVIEPYNVEFTREDILK